MKKFLLASAFAASMTLGLSSAAEARSSFHIYFGVPFYDYAVGPDYIYRSGYGWYDPGYGYDGYDDGYYPRYRHRDRDYGRLSCGEARRKVRNRGYRDVQAIECNGITYTFRGWRNGRPHQLLVNSRTGAVWRG